MKIQFLKPHTDGFGKSYLPGWVADWSEPDALRAIADGFAKLAPEGAFCRKMTDASFMCAAGPAPALPLGGGFISTGEELALEELTEQQPQNVPKTVRFRL